jgi:hypothetical protein
MYRGSSPSAAYIKAVSGHTAASLTRESKNSSGSTLTQGGRSCQAFPFADAGCGDFLSLHVAFNGLLVNCKINDKAVFQQGFKLAVADDFDVGASEVVLNHQDNEKNQHEVPNGELVLFIHNSNPALSNTFSPFGT